MINPQKTAEGLPTSLVTRLYDCTGSCSDGTKGFLLFFINEDGNPSIHTQTSNGCVDMALHKLIEVYISQPTQKTKTDQ
jgi:hypothetical protein